MSIVSSGERMAVQSDDLNPGLRGMQTKQGKEYRQGQNGQKGKSSPKLSGAEGESESLLFLLSIRLEVLTKRG